MRNRPIDVTLEEYLVYCLSRLDSWPRWRYNLDHLEPVRDDYRPVRGFQVSGFSHRKHLPDITVARRRTQRAR